MVKHFGEKAALFGVGLYGTSGGPMFPIWVVQRAERIRGLTRADLKYEGSIGIDERLVEAAGFLPGKAV